MFLLISGMHPAMSDEMLCDLPYVIAFALRHYQYTVLLQGDTALMVAETLSAGVALVICLGFYIKALLHHLQGKQYLCLTLPCLMTVHGKMYPTLGPKHMFAACLTPAGPCVGVANDCEKLTRASQS